jgi:uncharacterized membrane protein
LYKNNWTKNRTTAILPNLFKIPGIVVLVGCAITPTISRISKVTLDTELRNLFIIIGLIIICLSKEKDENENYNYKRFLSLLISLITVVVIYQFFLIFNFFGVKELSAAQFPICVLASYLLVFHWYKKIE